MATQAEFYGLPADLRYTFWDGFNKACNDWLRHVGWMPDPIMWKLDQVHIPGADDTHKKMLYYVVKYPDMLKLDNMIEEYSMGLYYDTPSWMACSAAYGICLANHKNPYRL